ncbi:hypothetical protein JKP88DRAFT_147328, partial [Tribonema minus]
KRALKPSYFSRNHFSSRATDDDDPTRAQTRLVVRILEGNGLLVADLLTGTSDPLCLAWVSSKGDDALPHLADPRLQRTPVCKLTVDPLWNSELVFPLRVTSVRDILAGAVHLVVLDEDTDDGTTHYEDLGALTIPLRDVVADGE